MAKAKAMSRDERQALSMQRWIQSNGRSSIEAATGFGKTRVAINIIKWLQGKHPDIRIFIVVPTVSLRGQWLDELKEHECLLDHTEVMVINSVVMDYHVCDLLILDEIHRYAAETFKEVFARVKYFMILGLTATFERLDGKHRLLARFAPVVDRVTMEECLANKWVSTYKEYVVLIDPLDIEVYDELTKQFTEHFEFFDYDFPLAMSMVGPKGWKSRQAYARQICRDQSRYDEVLKMVTYHAVQLMRAIHARKTYVYEHPEKLRVAEEIIAHRPEEKIITFSASVAMAEKFKDGLVVSNKATKKKNRITLDEFSKMDHGIVHSIKLLEEGIDVPDLTVGIMLGVNSSKTKRAQTKGRVVRYQKGKKAEFFTLVMNNTVELEWWRRSTNNGEGCIIIDEKNLMKVLDHKPYRPYKGVMKKFTTRF